MQNELNDSRAAFPNRIRALIVDSDERFLRSASLMLCLLNFRVATCETPASAVKLLSGRLSDADVVFIDALRATTCGFDFRGIVEPHMFIPVVYFFSFDYKVAGKVAEDLQRNVWTATYLIKKPLDAEDLCRLWRVIGWSKILLQRGKNTLSWTEWPRDSRALPAAIQALLPSSSTSEDRGEEEDDDNDLFMVVRAGRGQRRKLDDNRGGGSSSHCRGRGRGGSAAGSLEIGGQPTRRLQRMNVTEVQQSDDDVVPSYQLQPTQQNQRVQATDVQNQQHGQSLLMQAAQMLNFPCNNHMISGDAAGPSSSNVAGFAVANNTSPPASLLPLPVCQIPTQQATSPALHTVYQQQQRQPVAMARARRGRRRKLGDNHDGCSSSCGQGGVIAVGQPTRIQQQINVTQGLESDDDDVVPSHQQSGQHNRRGVQTMDVQNQQHSHSLFMQRVSRMLNRPHNNSRTSVEAAGPSSSSYATTFAGASNISTPAQPRATSPAQHVVYSAQAPVPGLPPVHQHQQPAAFYDLGNMVAPPAAAVPTMAATSGHQPQFTLNQQQEDMFALQRQDSRMMGHRRETGPIMLSFQQPPAADPFTLMAGGDTTFGASPVGATDAGSYGDASVAHHQSPSVGAQPADSFDDVLRAMMEMDDKFPRSYDANCSVEALMAPATYKQLAPTQAALDSGNYSSQNAGSFMVMDVNGGNSASFMAPQDPAMPTVNQVELGAPEFYGSLVESPGPSAMFNGNGDMAEMFASDQYDENAMLSLNALWNFNDDVPMHHEGQQVAAADSTTTTNATGIVSNGGESGGLGPNWNMRAADNSLDMLEEYSMENKASDFLHPQDNDHQ